MSDVMTHKCPNCDGPLLFNPTKQLFHCEFCSSEYTENDITSLLKTKVEEIEVEIPIDGSNTEGTGTGEHTDANGEHSGTTLTTLELFSCPSCGAEVVTEETTAATFCYYCHNPVVLSGRVSGDYLPESVLPFSIDKETAIEQFLTWGKKQKFVPKDFFGHEQIEKISGVYFPYWLVEGNMKGNYRANAKTLRVWIAGDIEMTETKYFNIIREGTLNFKNLIKNALKKNNKLAMIESVQPFDTNKAKAFSSKYLAGFLADKRDLDYEDLSSEVQAELESYGSAMMKGTVQGFTQIYQENMSYPVFEDKHQYILLPVWVLTYRGKNTKQDEPFYFAMNGDTGKISGKLPIDKTKLGLRAAAIFSGVLALLLLGGWFL